MNLQVIAASVAAVILTAWSVGAAETPPQSRDADSLRRAIQALVEQVSDEECASRALDDLALLGPAARDAIGPLVAFRAQNWRGQPTLARVPDITLRMVEDDAQAAVSFARATRELRDGDFEPYMRILPQAGPRAVSGFRAALADPEPGTRASAARILGALSTKATPAVPTLVATLDDPEPKVRRCAAEALGKIGAASMAAVQKLVQVVRADEDPGVRFFAVTALGSIGVAARPAVPTLIKALEDHHDPNEQFCIAWALTRVGPDPGLGVRALLDAVRTVGRPPYQDALLVWQLSAALAQLGRPACEPLTEALRDDSAAVRALAAASLGLMGEKARPALPALVKAARDGERRVRFRALLAVGQVAPRATEAVAPLTAGLRDESWPVRAAAAEALASLQSVPRDALPPLAAALRDQQELVVAAAAAALARFGPDAVEAVPSLIAALERLGPPKPPMTDDRVGPVDEDEVLAGTLQHRYPRTEICTAFGAIGPPARGAVPILLKELRTEDGAGFAAGSALARIGSAALPGLTEAVSSKDSMTRMAAVRALGEAGPQAASAVPALVAWITGPGPHGVETSAAYEALACIGPAATPALVTALERPDAEARRRLLGALARMRADAREAVPKLVAALDDESGRYDRLHVQYALGEIGPPAIPALRQWIERKGDRRARPAFAALAQMGEAAAAAVATFCSHEHHEVRQAALWALGTMREKGRPAAPALIELLADRAAWTRRMAAWVLGEIGAAEAREPLRRRLSDEETDVRVYAAAALRKLGEPPTQTVPVLIQALRTGENPTWPVAELAESGEEAVAPLAEIVGKDNPTRLRIRAATALGGMHARARTAVPALIAALTAEDNETRTAAAKALGSIGPLANAAVPHLVAMLPKEGDLPTSYWSGPAPAAAEALGKMGSAASFAVPALNRALGLEGDGWRMVVRKALLRIEGRRR